MLKRRISRRRFMKTGLALATGTATSLSATYKSNTQTKSVSRTSLKPLRDFPTTCELCPAGCGIIAYLDGERLVQILGNPNHPNNQGGICAKGIAGINLVNDPERLLYPLKRIGPRGSGQWTRITWDEIYSTLSLRIKEMIKERRIGELLIDKGKDDPLLDRFVLAVGSTHIIDRPALKNINRDTAFNSMIGSSWLIEDVRRSRLILNFGANPYSNHDLFIGLARRMVDARVKKGAKLITFDVRMSETAAKSDSWHPIKAGTDGAVALAMAKVIVEKGLADRKFIDRQTNFSLSRIKQHLSPYTPHNAERESGLRAADIEQLAVEFATQKPSVAIVGGGASDHVNGTQNVRCVALLNWLVGNLEKEGGLFFPRLIESLQLKAYSPYIQKDPSKSIKGLKDLREAETIDTYFACLSNPAYSSPDCESAAHFLKDEKNVPFLVVMDTHLTETAMIADMVLPAATYLEGWGVSSAPSLDMEPVLNLRQPVVSLLSDAEALRSPIFEMGKLLEPSFRPRGESKEIGDLCLNLARRIGGDVSKGLSFTNTQEFVADAVSSIQSLRKQDGLKVLKRHGFWFDKTRQSSTTETIPGKIKKVNVYSDSLKQNGLPPLPEYQPITSHKKNKANEFILTMFKSNLRAKGTTNSKWAREILHKNCLWINRDAAKRLNLKNKDRVRITSSVGTLIVHVLTTDRIHPESVALAEGFGNTAVGNVAKARRFKSNDKDTILIWWDKKGNGVNPNKIIERKTDPVGGGQGLKDTLVRLEKI